MTMTFRLDAKIEYIHPKQESQTITQFELLRNEAIKISWYKWLLGYEQPYILRTPTLLLPSNPYMRFACKLSRTVALPDNYLTYNIVFLKDVEYKTKIGSSFCYSCFLVSYAFSEG